MSIRDLVGGIVYLAYYFGFVAFLAILDKSVKVPKEVMRKSHHILCSLSIFILIRLFDNWYAAAIASMVPFLLGYIAVFLSRKLPILSSIRFGRAKQEGELSRQTGPPLCCWYLSAGASWGRNGSITLLLA